MVYVMIEPHLSYVQNINNISSSANARNLTGESPESKIMQQMLSMAAHLGWWDLKAKWWLSRMATGKRGSC